MKNEVKSMSTRFLKWSLPAEWWHFTLENEPYPDTYFDFPVDMPEG